MRKLLKITALLVPFIFCSPLTYGKNDIRSQTYQNILKNAQGGLADAEVAIGEMYYKGEGVPINLETARSWFSKAAFQGDAGGLFYMGLFCQYGYGGEKDSDKAKQYYERAYLVGKLTTPIFYLGSHLSPQAASANNLGYMYMTGDGIPLDYGMAYDWYTKSIDHGGISAMFNIGEMYMQGKGRPQNFNTAFEWYKKAADAGDAKAQFQVGILYYKGKGTTQNKVMAMKMIKLSADQGFEPAVKLNKMGEENQRKAQKARSIQTN